MIVREETEEDRGPVAELLRQAFGGEDEARLMARLRDEGDVALALVAESGGAIAGHVAFSPMKAPFAALGLAPLAVHPEFQGRGIGSALVREGVRRARTGAWDAVFVLGEPDYYGRFGFSAGAASGFESPYAGPHFMLLALASRLPARTGRVDYVPAFSGLG